MCGVVPNMLDTCLRTHKTKRVSLAFHVDDFLLAGTHQVIEEILTELSRDLELQSSEVATKPTRCLGRTLVKTKEGYNFGVDASYVENMLEEFNMSALKSSPTLRWERRVKDEKQVPASEQRVYRQLVGKLLWIDRADLRYAMGRGLIKPWKCARHGREKHQINPAIPPWKPWNHDSTADDTQSRSCGKSSCGLTVVATLTDSA